MTRNKLCIPIKPRDMCFKRCQGISVDYRSNISFRQSGIAQVERSECASESLDDAIGTVMRQEQQPERGAALTCRAEGRDDDIVDDLLLESGCIHEHRV